MHPDLDHKQALTRRLRGLPPQTSQPYDWLEFQRRTRRRGQPAAALTGGRAAAAAAVLSLGVVALWTRLGAPPPAEPAFEPVAAAAPAPHTVSAERWLESLPSEPAVVRVGTRAAVTGLEDRIAQMDDLLSTGQLEQPPAAQLLALQRERTRLVGALAQVRYAETLADQSR
jgi:hypothetical protein